jgi:nicotinamide mononucleotide transporter
MANALKGFQKDTLAMVGLLLVVTALAAWSKAAGLASWLESVSFVTGAVCVWLAVKEKVWNFPIGLVNAATFSVVFFQAQLFADAGLQIVYFVMILIGWYLWLRGGVNRTELRVARAGRREMLVLAGLTAATTVGLWRTLHLYGGSASFWDALTTSMSLSAQWLLNKKRVENWLVWIAVNVIYVPLYLYKDLYLTALLYLVFLAMAVIGHKQWRQALAAQDSSGKPAVGAAS